MDWDECEAQKQRDAWNVNDAFFGRKVSDEKVASLFRNHPVCIAEKANEDCVEPGDDGHCVHYSPERGGCRHPSTVEWLEGLGYTDRGDHFSLGDE